jgi:hypothetical protein
MSNMYESINVGKLMNLNANLYEVHYDKSECKPL